MSFDTQKNPTPSDFFKCVEGYFGLKFKYDMAASNKDSKCPYYFDEEDDSLSFDWPIDAPCWLNPPFKNLTIWVNKCYEQSLKGAEIVSIWPLSSDKNQKVTWKNSLVTVVFGRVWVEVRGVMLCYWGSKISSNINFVEWDRKLGRLTCL